MDDETWEPIDVMLEEVLRAPAAPAPSSRPRRLLAAAVVVLGLGAVLGTFAWRERVPTDLPVPRPVQAPDRVVPQDLAEFQQLLGTATALRVVHREVVGTTREGPAHHYLDLADWRQTVDVAGEALAVWRRELAASAPARWRGAGLCFDVHVLLPDGRAVVCFASLPADAGDADRATIGIGNADQPPLRPTPALQELLRAAHATIARAHRLASGIAETIDELQDLPVDQRVVTCPVAEPAALRAALARFPKLDGLRLRAAADGRPVDAAVLRAIADLPLARLAIAAGSLADADLAPLATMASLRGLTLRNGGARLTGSGFAGFVQPNFALGLDACSGLTPAGLATLTRLPRLRGLHLLQPNAAALAFVGSQLPKLASLDTLQVWSRDFTDDHLQGLAATRLRTLWLGETQVTRRGLAGLGGLPELAILTLAGTAVGSDAVAELAAMPRLTALTIHNSAFTDEGAIALRAALPRCEIRLRPTARVLDLGRELDPMLRD